MPEIFQQLRRRREGIGPAGIAFFAMPMIESLRGFDEPTAWPLDAMRIFKTYERLAGGRTENERITDAVRALRRPLGTPDDELHHISAGCLEAPSVQGQQDFEFGLFFHE